MVLTEAQADTIAALLNARNQLTVQYTRDRVQAEAEDYCCVLSDTGEVIACVQIKKVQWYQCEVLHLTVSEPHVSKGYGKALRKRPRNPS